ncbi:TetR/AcrR family transcriptional regulator [Mycobacterium sp. E2497]|uniref:TetR/AcrR family transcriptional regulator n=1 Tax=Mycobacterium sp. E2497 TaxID=1834135 RepID=UPI0007FFFE59|nr:helix-turn-helix domain-containing protein [Mycobacterium sp. E2497]OBI16071.1 hypothetical protein A5713_22495 [Mycobacterium sp. E2497]
MTTATNRHGRADSTRNSILAAAEMLFGTYGVTAVSHRQIVAATRQRNHAAVGYHFGTKTQLVTAIENLHRTDIDRRLQSRIDDRSRSDDLTAWISCLVHSYTDHLGSLTIPSWYARFCARTLTDPTYGPVLTRTALSSSPLRYVISQISERLPDHPADTLFERRTMARILLNHTCADYESDFAAMQSRRKDWQSVGTALVDTIVGLWLAPVTPRDW